jgi:hypothetical protein
LSSVLPSVHQQVARSVEVPGIRHLSEGSEMGGACSALGYVPIEEFFNLQVLPKQSVLYPQKSENPDRVQQREKF